MKIIPTKNDLTNKSFGDMADLAKSYFSHTKKKRLSS